jgi:amino-acid N-acetyltransferase
VKRASRRRALKIRKACLADVVAIHRLVNEFAAADLMLPLSVGDVTDRLRDFWVAYEDDQLAGTVALHVTWAKLVEVRSLAVRKETQRRGLGERLVKATLKEAKELGAEQVFTLTYVPNYFKRFGFRLCDRGKLPHKVWVDCVKCPKFPDCGETALLLNLYRTRKKGKAKKKAGSGKTSPTFSRTK